MQQLKVEPQTSQLVERPERLIEEQQFRLGDQSPDDGGSLPHAIGELRGSGPFETLKTYQADEISDGLPADADPAHLQGQPDISGDGAPRQQGCILERDAEPVRDA